MNMDDKSKSWQPRNQLLKELPISEEARQQLINMLNGTLGNEIVVFENCSRSMIEIDERDVPTEVKMFDEQTMSNCSLRLRTSVDSLGRKSEYWLFSTGQNYTVFSDKVMPDEFDFLTTFSGSVSIVSLYIGLVFVVHRFVRSTFLTGVQYRAMYTELPQPKRVWRLINDMYLAREEHEWLIEEDLFAKLLYLYRCPEAMFKYTKFKLS